MNQITSEALEFVEEAKKMFTENDAMTTYRNEKEEFVALRGGFLDRSMTVYELGRPVGYFIEQLPSQHKELVDYEDYQKLKEYKKIREFAEERLMISKDFLSLGIIPDLNNGYSNAMTDLLNMMTKLKI